MSLIKDLLLMGLIALFPYIKNLILLFTGSVGVIVVFVLLLNKEILLAHENEKPGIEEVHKTENSNSDVTAE